MTIKTTGIIRSGRFIPSEPLSLPENTRATAEFQPIPEAAAPPNGTNRFEDDPLTRVIGRCEGPPDLAENMKHQLSPDPIGHVVGIGERGLQDGAGRHDHYLYGIQEKESR